MNNGKIRNDLEQLRHCMDACEPEDQYAFSRIRAHVIAGLYSATPSANEGVGTIEIFNMAKKEVGDGTHHVGPFVHHADHLEHVAAAVAQKQAVIDYVQRQNSELETALAKLHAERATPAPVGAAPADERALFENWLSDVHGLDSEWVPDRNCFKDYPAHLAFQAFKAGRASLPSAGAPVELDCWSCKRPYAPSERIESDGMCPHCGVEIEIEDESAGAPVSGAEQAPPVMSDEDAYASSGYRHFMTLESFKAFRADCIKRGTSVCCTVPADVQELPALPCSIARFADSKQRGLLLVFPERPTDAQVEQVRAALTTAMRQQQNETHAFAQGYFCAVAVLLKETGCVSTEVQSLFSQGGNIDKADPYDIETFQQYGLMPDPESVTLFAGIAASKEFTVEAAYRAFAGAAKQAGKEPS